MVGGDAEEDGVESIGRKIMKIHLTDDEAT